MDERNAQLQQQGMLVIGLAALFLTRTALGRSFYAVGGNPHAAVDLQAEAVYGLTEFYRGEIAKGRLVAGTGSPHAPAELTVALMMAARRNIVVEAERMRRGEWPMTLSHRLSGSTLGIFGLGSIGSIVARAGAGLGFGGWAGRGPATR